MDKLYIIKIGGNIIDDETQLDIFLQSFARVKGHKLLVHGGGRLATRMAGQLHIPQQVVDGRRITDAETLKIVTMVYAGYINKNIVARLQALQCNALGLCGADGNAVLAHKRVKGELDYGFAGDIDAVQAAWISQLIAQNLALVMAPITHDGKGQLLNTNADTLAQELARSLCNIFEVHLVYSFEKKGVLENAADETTWIPVIGPALYAQLKKEEKIFAGMIPKLDNAFAALDSGVKRVIIGKAEELDGLLEGRSGTSIVHEP